MKYDVITIKTASSPEMSGSLSFFESEKDIPFPIRRFYYIYGAEKDVHRGFHAHKENYQLLFCLCGMIEIILDDGDTRETVVLDDPRKGLVLYPGLWREMIWRNDGAILCVAASEYYDEQDYIRDYDEFLTYSKRRKEVSGA